MSLGEKKPKEQRDSFLEDLEQIKKLCENYDFTDAASNQRLHRYLKDKKLFGTWIGNNFMIGLGNRSHSVGFRQVVERSVKILCVSFLLLALVLVSAFGIQRVQEVKEDAVLEYIRKEREIARKTAKEQKKQEKTEKAEKKESETEAPVETETEEVSKEPPDVLNEYAAFANMYPDTIGWLKVDGTPIDYPVMQDKTGGEYYLHHNFQGESDRQGALFVDKDSQIWPQDENIVIYGHNMRNNSIFGSLDNYLDRDYYEKNKFIEFDTLYEKARYRIVAVIKTAVKQKQDDGFRYYWFHNYGTEEEFQEFLMFVDDTRVYDTGEEMAYGDHMIMLSTCEYSVDNGRLVVIARKE